MPDDCPVDDGSRRALRDLARRAEWRGQAGAAGAAQDAATLRELGAEMRAALARQEDQASSWGRQSVEQLAAYCVKARADWTPEQIAELSRLREDAVIALAPGPGESDIEPPAPPRRAAPKLPAGLSALLGPGRTRPVILVVIGCVVLIALVLTLPHFFSSNDASTSASSSASTSAPAAPTTAATAAPTTPTSAPTSPTSTASISPTSAPTTATSSAVASTSHVTSIQITADPLSGNPPEVIISGTINASGTDDVYVNVTVDGITPSDVSPIDDSGQTSYNLTQTINLSQWCGKSSVVVTVSSGAVSKSTTVPVSCSN